jgi:predicted amidohydrolase YtcJ
MRQSYQESILLRTSSPAWSSGTSERKGHIEFGLKANVVMAAAQVGFQATCGSLVLCICDDRTLETQGMSIYEASSRSTS